MPDICFENPLLLEISFRKQGVFLSFLFHSDYKQILSQLSVNFDTLGLSAENYNHHVNIHI